MKHSHLWRNYNGPGRPITKEQLEELLAKEGIYPRIKDGREGYIKADFEAAWQKYGIKR